MIANRLLAGAVAGIPVSLLCLAYLLVRRDQVAAAFTSGPDPMPEGAATLLAFGTAIFVGPALGLAAALVEQRMSSENAYLALAFGAATVMTAVALATRTPLAVAMIVLNYAVALALGWGLPRLVA